MSTENYQHDLYKHVENVQDADAVAYAFVNPEKTVFFPYKQQKVEAHEIKADILYTGLCLSDSHHGRGQWNPNVPYPMAPGHEIIAEVVEVGADVKDFKKGDKVAFGTTRLCCDKCKYCKMEKEPLCIGLEGSKRQEKMTYNYQWGGYSTQLIQPASHFFKLKENVKLDKAAPLLCAGVTVYNPIDLYCKPGMKTAVVGIGGLGHLAVQFLSKLGYEVDAITTSIENEKLYKELGAKNVVNSKDPEALAKSNKAYDFIINTSPSGKNYDDILSLVAPGGYLCQVGLPYVSDKISFTCMLLVANEINIVGSLVGSRSVTQRMLDICVDKDIYPITEMFEFEDFPKALDKLEHGKPHFRCVVNCKNYAEKNGLKK